MKLTTTKLMAIELTSEERTALETVYDVIVNFHNKAISSFEEGTYQSPIYGDVITLDELPRTIGILDFFLKNPIVHAIESEG